MLTVKVGEQFAIKEALTSQPGNRICFPCLSHNIICSANDGSASNETLLFEYVSHLLVIYSISMGVHDVIKFLHG